MLCNGLYLGVFMAIASYLSVCSAFGTLIGLGIYGGKFSYIRKFIGVYAEIYFRIYENLATFEP